MSNTNETMEEKIDRIVTSQIPANFRAPLSHMQKPAPLQAALRDLRAAVVREKAYARIDASAIEKSLQYEAALAGQLLLLDCLLQAGYTPDETGQLVPAALIEVPNFHSL